MTRTTTLRRGLRTSEHVPDRASALDPASLGPRRPMVAGRLPVLMYHSVPADGPGDVLSVPLPRLRAQWQTLRQAGWELMGITAGLAAKRLDPKRRIVALTFDDALADFALVPEVLARMDASATLYVPTAHVGQSAVPLGYGHAGVQVMGWSALADLPDCVEIGSHGHRHRPLDILARAELVEDLSISRRLLRERTGREPTSLCYPHGYAGRSTAAAAQFVGFDSACALGHRVVNIHRDDPWRLPRLHVLPEHDGDHLMTMVTRGAKGAVPRLKALAQPGWRVVRRGAYRSLGTVLT